MKSNITIQNPGVGIFSYIFHYW